MDLAFRFYTDDDFLKLEKLILASYRWGNPIWSFSRHEFCLGIHVAWGKVADAWRHTAGIWEEDGKIAAAVIGEGVWDGETFFLFDSLERQQDERLLLRMFHHAETHMSCIPRNHSDKTRFLHLTIQPEYRSVRKVAQERGYALSGRQARSLVMPFAGQPMDVRLPEGHALADGRQTPDFFLSNTHMFSFNYTLPIAETIESGFHNLRRMPGYNPELDLCVLDPDGKPVGIAIIWYNEKMPYCELEPLGVVWWARRCGIGRALIHEACNRVMKLAPDCRGMLGGDQPFYWDLGFQVEASHETWDWSRKFQ